jgi:beta-glucosidase
METYRDRTKNTVERIEDLLARMTLEEKLAQVSSDLPVKMIMAGPHLGEILRQDHPHGLGRITQYSMAGLMSREAIISISKEIQKYFVENTRLGIPVTLQSESLCGYPGREGTIFPSMLNLAATFEPALVEEMANIISAECRAVGIRQVLSPVLDVSRDPRWGRVYETYGEDTYLVTQMGAAHVRGLQKNLTDGVLSTAKHFLGYSETEGGRNTAPTRMGNRELYEVFATPFEAAIKQERLAAIMASYAEIDGIPCGANKKITGDLLRDTMGFKGLVVSDGGGVRRLWEVNHIAKDYEEAGLLGIQGGMETEMPIGASYRKLGRYLETGELNITTVDTAVRHVLQSKFDVGLFDDPYGEEADTPKIFSLPRRQELSQEIAEKSIVLLKNEGAALPIKPGKKIALIGPHGGEAVPSMSGYSIVGYFEMQKLFMNAEPGSSGAAFSFTGVADAVGAESSDNRATKKNPREAITTDIEKLLKDEFHATTLVEELAALGTVSYARGCDIMDMNPQGIEEAVHTAEANDLVIMTLGGNCGWGKASGGEGKDRSSLALPGIQQELLNRVAETGKDIVVILYGPGIYTPVLPQNVKALLYTWLPGPGGAKALTAVVSGTVNPGGKLPVSIPRSAGQLLHYYNHKAGNGLRDLEGGKAMPPMLQGGYTNDEDTVLYPFGFGLSYTEFIIDAIKVASPEVSTGGIICISCKVKNTGTRAGSDVVQLYYHDAEARVTRPVRELVGFEKVYLEPGQSADVQFSLSTAQLGFYNEGMAFVVEPGTAELWIGNSSENLSEPVKVQLTGPKVHLSGKRVYTCQTGVEIKR